MWLPSYCPGCRGQVECRRGPVRSGSLPVCNQYYIVAAGVTCTLCTYTYPSYRVHVYVPVVMHSIPSTLFRGSSTTNDAPSRTTDDRSAMVAAAFHQCTADDRRTSSDRIIPPRTYTWTSMLACPSVRLCVVGRYHGMGVCRYVRAYVRTYVCMYVRMYVCRMSLCR